MNDDRITLPDLNFERAEKKLCMEALRRGRSLIEASALLGLTRHALKRRIIKHRIEWPLVSPAASE